MTYVVNGIFVAQPTLATLERWYVERVYAETGNKAQTAKRLGVDRRTLYRMLERYKKQDEGEQLNMFSAAATAASTALANPQVGPVPATHTSPVFGDGPLAIEYRAKATNVAPEQFEDDHPMKRTDPWQEDEG